jgi:adenine deaminase
VSEAGLSIRANIVDVRAGRVFAGTLEVVEGRIGAVIEDRSGPLPDTYLLPGFVDAHVHVESSLLVPTEFARLVAARGTVAAVADPHEIANVLGVDGVRFMIDNGRDAAIRFAWGAPSCVPATSLETSGARLGPAEVSELLDWPEVTHLAEMMDFPGVLAGDSDLMAKIDAARARGKPVDGHAPGLVGDELARYIAAGITTDHESLTLGEAREKLARGMKVLVREGSGARDFDMLAELIEERPYACMLCSDDAHPDWLVEGHIDRLVRRGVRMGLDVMKVLRCACMNPIDHYGLDVGLLGAGESADMIEVGDLETFAVMRTWSRGQLVAEGGRPTVEGRGGLETVGAPAAATAAAPNRFEPRTLRADDIRVPAQAGRRLKLIGVADGRLFTEARTVDPEVADGSVLADPTRDIAKIVVVNRYDASAPPAVGFVSGFGLARGALASSVAHDSHNVVAVGASDEAMCAAVNAVMGERGGLAVTGSAHGRGPRDTRDITILPLALAGLMSMADGFEVARDYALLKEAARDLSSPLSDALLTLSFMALLVIPELKLGDQGLFDGRRFEYVDLWE